MLRIYISRHCRGCSTALKLFRRLKRLRPHIPIVLIDIDGPLPASEEDPDIPVIGTPTYVWDHHVLFQGNPSEEELLAQIDRLSSSSTTH